MLNDICKLAAWDDLVAENTELRSEYNKICKIIHDMNRAMYQAKQQLEAVNASFLEFVEAPDEEIKPKRSRKK